MRKNGVFLRVAGLVLAITAPTAAHSQGVITQTVLVSVRSDDTQGSRDSFGPAISDDGRFVAFETASKLVPGDGNGASDIHVRNLRTGKTLRVSRRSAGSFNASISGDGRLVAYDSDATNGLVGDTNGYSDVFVQRRTTKGIRRVSLASSGAQGNSDSYDPAISAKGRVIAFWSYSSNLSPGDANGRADVFVRNLTTKHTSRVSIRSNGLSGNGGSYAPSISARGRVVAFDSFASNLIAGDTNDSYDVFIHDRTTKKTRRVSISTAGRQGDGGSYEPAISADARVVAFWSRASNLMAGDDNDSADVFIRYLGKKKTVRASVASDGSEANDASFDPAISADGRFVAFWSFASNLVVGDTNNAADVFVHDRETGQTVRVSVGSGDTQGNGASFSPALSDDGTFVAFESEAGNLVVGDTNRSRDIFRRKTSP